MHMWEEEGGIAEKSGGDRFATKKQSVFQFVRDLRPVRRRRGESVGSVSAG